MYDTFDSSSSSALLLVVLVFLCFVSSIYYPAEGHMTKEACFFTIFRERLVGASMGSVKLIVLSKTCSLIIGGVTYYYCSSTQFLAVRVGCGWRLR